MSNKTFITGKWHIFRWKGLKAEWRDFQNKLEIQIWRNL
jgi:hypothetical protein